MYIIFFWPCISVWFLVNGQLDTHFFNIFISVLYMFRATPCSSSGESIVSKQPLVYVTQCRWPFRLQVGKFLSHLHMKRSPTQSDIYQRLYWYNWFSWWWARGCSKHVENWNKENWNKYTEKIVRFVEVLLKGIKETSVLHLKRK